MLRRIREWFAEKDAAALAERIAHWKQKYNDDPLSFDYRQLFCDVKRVHTGRWHCLVTGYCADPEATGIGTTYVNVYRSPTFQSEAHAEAHLTIQLEMAKRFQPESQFYRFIRNPPPGLVASSKATLLEGRTEMYLDGKWAPGFPDISSWRDY